MLRSIPSWTLRLNLRGRPSWRTRTVSDSNWSSQLRAMLWIVCNFAILPVPYCFLRFRYQRSAYLQWLGRCWDRDSNCWTEWLGRLLGRGRRQWEWIRWLSSSKKAVTCPAYASCSLCWRTWPRTCQPKSRPIWSTGKHQEPSSWRSNRLLNAVRRWMGWLGRPCRWTIHICWISRQGSYLYGSQVSLLWSDRHSSWSRRTRGCSRTWCSHYCWTYCRCTQGRCRI